MWLKKQWPLFAVTDESVISGLSQPLQLIVLRLAVTILI
jgi:hypothetical protein